VGKKRTVEKIKGKNEQVKSKRATQDQSSFITLPSLVQVKALWALPVSGLGLH
jgi:hypothetical protein